MSQLCVDASLVVKVAIQEILSAEAFSFFDECVKRNITIIAPPLIEPEIDSIVRRRVYMKQMTEKAGTLAFKTIDALAIQIQTHPTVRRRAREIAKLYNQPRVYDSTYAALAQLRECDLWTADENYYNTVKKGLLFVQYLGNYKGLPS